MYMSAYEGYYTRNRPSAERVEFSAYGIGGDEATYKHRPYSKTCGLKEFYFSSEFLVYEPGNFDRNPFACCLTIQKTLD